MKKSILLNSLKASIIMILCLFFSQVSFSQILFSEDFDGIGGPTAGGAGTYSFPSGWLQVNVDNRTPAGSVAYVNEAWERREDFNINVVDSAAFSTSWYSPAGAADDWMWTPAIALTGSNPALSWRAYAMDPSYPDGYEVRIMIDPTVPSGSTGSIGNMLTNSTQLFSVGAENSSWTNHSVDLSAYTGQTVRIAFRNNSNDQFLLLIDDVVVENILNYDAAITAHVRPSEYSQTPLNQAPQFNPSVTVQNQGVQNLTSVTLTANVYDASNALVYTTSETVSGTLTPSSTQTITTTGAFIPSAAGMYYIDYLISSVPADQSSTNDLAQDSVFISDSVYARDMGILVGALGIGAGNGGYLGQQFEVTQTADLSSISVFHNSAYPTFKTGVAVFDMNAGVPNTMIYSSPETTLVAYTGWVDFALPPGFTLTPGTYVVTAVEIDSTIQVGQTTDIFTTGTEWVDWPTIPGGDWANIEDFGGTFAKAFMIRANLAEPCVDPATITCGGNLAVGTDAGVCTATVTNAQLLGQITASGGDPVPDITFSPAAGTFASGTTTVTATATNSCGSVTCTFDVVVTDDDGPTFVDCPSDITVSNDAGECDAVVTFTAPTATDNCGTPVVGSQVFSYTGSMQTFTVPVGVTSITIEALGGEGASGASGGFGVAGGPGGLGAKVTGTLAVTPGQTYNIFVGGAGSGATGGYNGGGAGGAAIAGGGGGATDIRFGGITAADRILVAGGGGGGGRAGCETGTELGAAGGAGGAGNGADGTSSPDGGGGFGAVGQTGGAAGIGCSGFLGSPGLSSTDENGAAGGGGQGCCCFSSPSIPGGGGGGGGYFGGGGGGGGSAGNVGCTGNNKGAGGGGAGGTNYSSGSFTGVSSVSGFQAGDGEVTISWNIAPVITIAQTGGLPSGSEFPVGTSTVTYTATDDEGNTSTCSFDVIVNDTEDPTITCPSDITVGTDAGVCSAVVTVPAPTGSDNCSVTFTNDKNGTANASGTYNAGTTTVVWTATDGAGNTTTCSQFVTVIDDENPNAVCQDITVDLVPLDEVIYDATTIVSAGAVEIAVPANGISTGMGDIITLGGTSRLINNVRVALANLSSNAPFDLTVSIYSDCSTNGAGNSPCGNGTGALLGSQTFTGITLPLVGFGYFLDLPFPDLDVSGDVDNTISVVLNVSRSDVYWFIDNTPTIGSSPASVTRCGSVNANNGCARVFGGASNQFYLQVTSTSDVYGAIVDGADLDGGSTDNCGVASFSASPSEFSCSDIGENTVTVTVTDDAGNTSTCTSTVTVQDVDAPVITCPGDITVGNDPGDCGAIVNYVATATDNCSATVTYDIPSGSFFAVGTTTTVTATATDPSGLTDVCTFTVTVEDTEDPIVDCLTDQSCNTYASTDVPVNIVDETSVTSTITVGASGTIADLNVLGLVGTHSYVSDLDVTLTSPAGTTVMLFSASCGSQNDFDVNFDDAGLANESWPCAPLGDGGTFQPNDALSAFNGENFNGVWTLTITDFFAADEGELTAWSLEICEAGAGTITVSNGVDSCEAAVTVPQPVFSDNCPGTTITNNYNSSADASDVYPLGTTTVVWTAEDAAGNISTCEMTVTVNDDQFPVIICPVVAPVSNDEGACGAVVTFNDPIVTDNCAFPLLTPFSGDPIDIMDAQEDDFGGINVFEVSGTQTISGLTGTSLGTDVFLQSVCLEVSHTWVNDLVIWLESPNGDQITLVASPPCGGDDLDVCFVPGTGNSINDGGTCGNLPAYSGNFNAESGDLGALSFGTDPNGVWTLYVNDSVPADSGLINNWTLTFEDVSGTVYATQTAGLPSGSEFPVGTTTNTFEITDRAGNTSTCSFDVVVSDTEDPTLTCPANITVDNDPDVCGAFVSYVPPVGTDNCDNISLTQSLSQDVTLFNSVACYNNVLDVTRVNSYIRVFDLPALGYANDFFINSVDFGIELAQSVGGLGQTATLNLYSLSGPLLYANMTLLTSETITIADQAEGILNIPLSSQFTVPAGTVLVVELVSSNGTVTGDILFVGSNAAGQTGDTYLAAAECDILEPTSTADIGYPEMNWVLNINAGVQTVFVSGLGPDVEFPVGTNTETYETTDLHGNSTTCSFDVTVEDVQAPEFTSCPSDVTGCESDVVTTYAFPEAWDNCTVDSIVQISGLPSGPFPAGITVNTFVAYDPALNTDTCSFTFTIYPNPVVDFTYFPTCIDEIVYFNADVTLDTVLSSEIVEYMWEFSDGSGPSYDVNPTHVYNAAGDYDVTLTVTTNHDCVTSTTYTVTIHPTPTFTTTVADALCNGDENGSITVDVTVGDAPIEYSINGGAAQSSNVFSGLGAGSYQISITDANGCSASAAVTVDEPEVLVASIESTTEALCFGQSSGAAEVSATGGTGPYSYSIDGGSSQSSGVFSGLTGGNHVVTVTDDNGCTTDITVTVGEPDEILVDASSQPVLCNGDASGSIEVTATGGTGAFQYSVDGGSNYQPTGSFSGLPAGTYVVVVEDDNGCSVSEGVVITEPSEALAATAEVQNVACTGDASGSVVVSATGGTGAYQYSIDGGDSWQSSNVFGELAAGDYTITVQDANGCTTDVDVTVEEPAELLASDVTATPVSCNGEGDGMIDVTVTGGDAPYEYSFNGGITWQPSGSFTNLAPGTYTVIVRDANGCEVASIVAVTQPDALTLATTASSPASCEGDNDGSFTVAAEGGTEPYTYTSNGNSNSTGVFSNVTSGTQLVTVTDESGCSVSVQVEVGYTNPLPDAAFSWFASGSVVQFSNQSTNGVSYSWNFGDGTTSTDMNPVHSYAAGGTYTVTLIVTNACGSDTVIWVIDTNSIGINDPNADASVLNVYPNPNHGQFTLNYTSTGVIGAIQVNVMTIEGKLLMAEQFTVNADTFVRNYSDIELAAGIYIVQFISQTGTEVKRITVDK